MVYGRKSALFALTDDMLRRSPRFWRDLLSLLTKQNLCTNMRIHSSRKLLMLHIHVFT
eukprot:COSAG01_NODE_4769_length_4754_cov_10.669388_6_plen_58_part_00